ncbi:MAG: hypothetical protein CL599_02745 [Alteromonas sp.]|nr:hypothetical protein [Alteromonas sp.]
MYLPLLVFPFNKCNYINYIRSVNILITSIMKEILSNNEIIDLLLQILELDNDNQLALELGVARQQIRQFRNSEQKRLPQIIITRLLQNK